VRYVTVAGERVSVIGLGTWPFTPNQRGGDLTDDGAKCIEIIEHALDLGVSLIDTAASYGSGLVEKLVGQAVRSRRAQALVGTRFMPIAPFPPIVARQARASRRRLGVEALDLYQIHRPNPRVPLRLQVADLRRLLAAGVIRHVGVSNYSLECWQAAERALRARIVSNQIVYNLVAQGANRDLIPWAAANDRFVIAHTPLGQGLLSGRYHEAKVPGDARSSQPLFWPENLRAAASLLDCLREIAAVHRATPAQIALAWVIAQPNVVAIPGARTVAQLEQNVAAADIVLSDDEHVRLSSAGAAFRPARSPLGASTRFPQRIENVRSMIRTLW
jgi:aryl-alcohol dehydrogenase-like predicted oxidoreductase